MVYSILKSLGKKPNKEKQKYYENICPNYNNGKFINTYVIKDKNKIKVLEEEYKNDFRNRKAKKEFIPIITIKKFPNIKEAIGVTWLGHSSSMVQINNKKILLDPVFTNNTSPFPMIGFKRFNEEIPIKVEELPYLDAVIISHNHYDHMDYETIKNIDKRVGHYYVPLGVECYLLHWGINSDKITAMNWWQESNLGDVTIACTPSNHFSGRNLFDRNTSLWASWVIKNENEKVFFSGDSAYGDHYKKIYEKYGDMDIALIECGQYNTAWSDSHMFPKQSLQACIDLKAKNIMPVHWGAFSLSFHKWNEPAIKMEKYSEGMCVNLIIPKIGETVVLKDNSKEREKWWNR